MSLPTRQQLIKGGSWPTAMVQTELGNIRVAKLSVAGSMRVENAAKADGDRLEAELSRSAILLQAACVDGEGSKLFADVAAAKEALDLISGESLTAIVLAVAGFSEPQKPKAGDEGNVPAGPS